MATVKVDSAGASRRPASLRSQPRAVASVKRDLADLHFRVHWHNQTYGILSRLGDAQYSQVLRLLGVLRADFAQEISFSKDEGIFLILPYARNLNSIAREDTINAIIASHRAMRLIRTDLLDLQAWGGPKLDLSNLPLIVQRSLSHD